jgi:hypothetical protein
MALMMKGRKEGRKQQQQQGRTRTKEDIKMRNVCFSINTLSRRREKVRNDEILHHNIIMCN